MSTSLDGKVAVVTGSSKGIGFAAARALLDAGCRVVLNARKQDELNEAAQRLGKPDAVHAVAGDVGRPEDAARLVEAAAARFGGLDILINNAGVGRFANVADMSIEDWRQVLDTNLSGVFYCCHAAIPHLKRRGGGWIINVSSLAGRNALPGGGAYCASKAGLNAFTESLMQEVRYDDIRVSYIMPGSVSTGFEFRGSGGEADWKLAPDDIARVMMDLLAHDPRSLPSRVEIRPSRPPRK
ncbi:MAG TPA: SDR family oxidoreductase [Vicinamibacterales bacterium]|nr:SDR family oxidoreductase [Vicinamibacterales bacterium]